MSSEALKNDEDAVDVDVDPHERVTTAPTQREWPLFTDNEKTPTLGLESGAESGVTHTRRAWPPPLPPPPGRAHEGPTVRPPSRDAIVVRVRHEPHEMFLPRAVPPPRSSRRAIPLSMREPVSQTNMALSQTGSQLSQRVPTRPNRGGWYVAGVLGVLLFLNVFHSSPDTSTHGSAAAVQGQPAQESMLGAPLSEPPKEESVPSLIAIGPTAPAAAAPSPAAPLAPTPAAKPAPGPPQIHVAGAPAAPASEGDAEISTAEAVTKGALLAQQSGDASRAAVQYMRALQANPSYFPASLGLADSQWTLGNKKAAQAEYRRMIATFPTAMIPERARSRAAEAL